MGKNICLTECTAMCCTNILIPITHIDVQRILKHKRIDVLNFVKIYTNIPQDWLDCSSAIVPIKIDNIDHTMAINITDHNDTCPFNKKLKCTIYAYRPMVCRIYPFMLTDTGYIEFHSNPKCPRKWDNLNIVSTRSSLLQGWEEVSIYRKRVAWWNTYCSYMSVNDFLEYIFDDLPPINHLLTSEEAFTYTINTKTNTYIPEHSKEFFYEFLNRENLTRIYNMSYKKLRHHKITQLKAYYRNPKES